MMRILKMIFAILITFVAININAADASTPAATGNGLTPCLVESIVFYRGYNVGSTGATNGPKVSYDNGKTWTGLAWSDAKGFSIDVSDDGKWLYVGGGNGVFVSRDGGRSWKLTGGWRITEVLDVRMDRRNPERAWAFTAYGLFRTEDGGASWTKPGDQQFGFGCSVCPDRTNPNRVILGSEKGIYITNDNGETYTKVGPDAIIRSVIQDSRGSDRWWAGTDGNGLWLSNDDGHSWVHVPGTGDIVNRVAQHPKYPERIYCGCNDGCYFSFDSGITWTKGAGKEFGEDSVFYGIAFDPKDARRIYAGCRDGFYQSRDAGATWKFVSQRNAVVQDVRYVNLYTGPVEIYLEKASWNAFKPPNDPKDKALWDDSDTDFDSRAKPAKELIAGRPFKDTVDPTAAVAIIKEGKATPEFYDALRNTLAKPGTSMFWSLPAITLYLFCQDELPADIKSLLRKSLVENNIYRGDTENHWVMYHTALLLTAQTWPDTRKEDWYNGMTSEYNYNDALEWLNEWFRITYTIGQGEFDSPVYMRCYVTPMLVLHEFAGDAALRREAGMMLDLLLADFAAEALDGRYCGGHSRIYDQQVRSGDGSQDGDFFYLYFGGIEMQDNINPWSVAALYGSYRCPQAIRDIAHRRDKSYIHTEVKRVRNIIRYADAPESPAREYGGEMNPPVFKYDYMTPDYCLGSLQGGILQPIQQHTWDVTWKGSASNTLCFSLHPYWSGVELAMFFPEDPHMLTSSVAHQKSGYTDENKWTSSSPYERIYQLEDTLMAVYNIPQSDIFPNHADFYIPKCLNHEEVSGWIFGHDGDFYIGIRPTVAGGWTEYDDYWRYRVPAGQAAFVVETGRQADDGSYDEFKASILRDLPPGFKTTDNGPEVRYTNRHGREMEYIWDGDKRLMDKPVTPFPTQYLFHGPLIESDYGSGIIKIYGDNETRVLDFNKWEVEEE